MASHHRSNKTQKPAFQYFRQPQSNLIQQVLTVADQTELSKTVALLEQWNVPIKKTEENRFASQWIQQLPDNRNATFCTNKYIIEL